MASKSEQLAPMTQFRSSNTQVSWRYQQVTISGHAMKTINFMDTSPNMFMVQNPNSATIYVGITSAPTSSNYEWKIASNTSKTFGRPISTKELFLLNTSSVDITINLFSVLDKFDLSLLADMTVNIDDNIASEIKGDGIINGFGNGVSLPRGTNHLGSVSIDNALTMSMDAETKSAITGTNDSFDKLIKGSEVSGLTNLFTICKHLNALMGDTNPTSLEELKEALTLVKNATQEVRSAVNSLSTVVSGGSVEPRFTMIYSDNKYEWNDGLYVEHLFSDYTQTPNYLILFSNDSDQTLQITFGTNDGYTSHQITLKAGESITDIPINFASIRITRSNTEKAVDYRLVFGHKE